MRRAPLAMDGRLSARDMLARLIAFPTVSSSSNLDCIDFIRNCLANSGVASTLVPNDDGSKANLYATIGPNVPGGVVLSGHTDVVPVERGEWRSDPWTLTERAGRLFGRGACDMKAFIALAIAAVPDMLAADLKAPIHIALSHDEEVGCTGAPALIREMARRVPAPRAVIVGEPTRMTPIIGHKSSLSFHSKVTGHSVHSSRIDQGVSAIMTAARLVAWLWDRMEENRLNADPASAFEPPYTTLHCGMIEGGTAANIVARSCTFVTDIRAIPSEDPWTYKERYSAYARDGIEPMMKAVAAESKIEIIHRSFVPGLRIEPDGPAERLVRELTGSAGGIAVSYATEAGLFQQAGWPAVVCGPGDIAQAHKTDEYIEDDQLAEGEAFLRHLIERLSA